MNESMNCSKRIPLLFSFSSLMESQSWSFFFFMQWHFEIQIFLALRFSTVRGGICFRQHNYPQGARSLLYCCCNTSDVQSGRFSSYLSCPFLTFHGQCLKHLRLTSRFKGNRKQIISFHNLQRIQKETLSHTRDILCVFLIIRYLKKQTS